jgi:CRISPR-associated protein Csd1
MFDPPEDYIKDDKLSGEFLLGYHCQRTALKPPPGKDGIAAVDESEEQQ